jgi:hypothetical protein
MGVTALGENGRSARRMALLSAIAYTVETLREGHLTTRCAHISVDRNASAIGYENQRYESSYTVVSPTAHYLCINDLFADLLH